MNDASAPRQKLYDKPTDWTPMLVAYPIRVSAICLFSFACLFSIGCSDNNTARKLKPNPDYDFRAAEAAELADVDSDIGEGGR